MSVSRSVLIVGGGTAGNGLAVLLRRTGIDVTLAEINPDWNVSGSGITLQGNALRVLREIGVWDEVSRLGYGFSSLGMTAPDGTVLAVSESARTGGPDLPPVLGMERAASEELVGGTNDGSLFIPVNNFLFQRCGATVLIDAGAGKTMQPTLGKLPANLRERMKLWL